MKYLIKKTPDNFIKTVNDEINSILNRNFDSLFPEFIFSGEMDKFAMPVEIHEKDNEYKIKAELPGVKKEDLEIERLIKGGYNSKIHPEASKVILQERTKMEQSRINSKAALPTDNSAMAMIIETDSLDVLKESMQNYKNAQE